MFMWRLLICLRSYKPLANSCLTELSMIYIRVYIYIFRHKAVSFVYVALHPERRYGLLGMGSPKRTSTSTFTQLHSSKSSFVAWQIGLPRKCACCVLFWETVFFLSFYVFGSKSNVTHCVLFIRLVLWCFFFNVCILTNVYLMSRKWRNEKEGIGFYSPCTVLLKVQIMFSI